MTSAPSTTNASPANAPQPRLNVRSSLAEVRRFCNWHNLPHYQSRDWIWVIFALEPGLDVRMLLRRNRFYWSNRRQGWFHPCGTNAYKIGANQRGFR